MRKLFFQTGKNEHECSFMQQIPFTEHCSVVDNGLSNPLMPTRRTTRKRILKYPSIALMSMVLMIFAMATSCEKPKAKQNEDGIKFVKSELGGCNGQNAEDLKRNTQQGEGEKDTIIFDLQNDTLNVFFGFDYTCCALFTLNQTITADTIYTFITDASAVDDYCRCTCYYSFLSHYTDLLNGRYVFKFIVDAPQMGYNTTYTASFSN
jgi:hypothetical protein